MKYPNFSKQLQSQVKINYIFLLFISFWNIRTSYISIPLNRLNIDTTLTQVTMYWHQSSHLSQVYAVSKLSSVSVTGSSLHLTPSVEKDTMLNCVTNFVTLSWTSRSFNTWSITIMCPGRQVDELLVLKQIRKIVLRKYFKYLATYLWQFYVWWLYQQNKHTNKRVVTVMSWITAWTVYLI